LSPLQRGHNSGSIDRTVGECTARRFPCSRIDDVATSRLPATNRARPMGADLLGKYLTLQSEVRAFIAKHGHRSPKPGEGDRSRARRRSTGRSCSSSTAICAQHPQGVWRASACRSMSWSWCHCRGDLRRPTSYPGIMNQGISMLVPTLLDVGTKEQCTKWIAPTSRGEVIWCQGLLRARIRQRSGRGQDKSRGEERPFRDQRAEDLDQLGSLLRHDVPAVPHRAGQATSTRG